jgi:predicted regulator of Ras-like GTPase activity (Roadblock/LC7/MglB family)
MDAGHALTDLLEVSPQIEAAVIVDRKGGKPQASSFGAGDERAQRLAALSLRILEQAETARGELEREPVVQCEVATEDGSVFVVSDAQHLVTAVTGNEPTVGLIFYDLKVALRGMRGATNGSRA